MGRRNRKGDRDGVRLGAKVYGAPDQSSGYVATVKCQYSQVSGTCGRDKRDSLGSVGTTWIPIRQYLQGFVHPMVGVREDSPS